MTAGLGTRRSLRLSRPLPEHDGWPGYSRCPEIHLRAVASISIQRDRISAPAWAGAKMSRNPPSRSRIDFDPARIAFLHRLAGTASVPKPTPAHSDRFRSGSNRVSAPAGPGQRCPETHPAHSDRFRSGLNRVSAPAGPGQSLSRTAMIRSVLRPKWIRSMERSTCRGWSRVDELHREHHPHRWFLGRSDVVRDGPAVTNQQ
jgi:hypothetical protein